jgi:hypothetical protein
MPPQAEGCRLLQVSNSEVADEAPNLIHLIFLMLSLFAVVPPAAAQQAPAYYIFDGRDLDVMDERHVQASYIRWQIWLYPERVPIPRQTTRSTTVWRCISVDTRGVTD